ncbi:MAG: Hsp70 family protein [Planctomycetes bacterium]|nr:Hsp70 family protein [Planctomycetota bacterium]
MARIGIDYGTTNTVVVCSDRGRYPVVPHQVQTAVGPVSSEVFPSLAVRDRHTGGYLFGARAEQALARPRAGERYEVIRSLKRYTRDYTSGVPAGNEEGTPGFELEEVLTSFAQALHGSLRESGLFREDEPFETVLTWPANANGAQRHITRKCFKKGGFQIVDTLNEPTAAAIEFSDRISQGNRTESRNLSMSIAVFDLGGGTFDVSLVRIDGMNFQVVDSTGIDRLGGDDFDEALAGLFAEKLKVSRNSLTPFQQDRLLVHARQQKESIATGTVRSLVLNPCDLGLDGNTLSVSVSDYFEHVKGLLDPALEKMITLLNGKAAEEAGIRAGNPDAIYLVGGGSRLPLVIRRVAEAFPKVKKIYSDKPFTSTAMGAAIRSAEQVKLREILARNFGAIRLMEHGKKEFFSPIFPAGTRIPRSGEPDLERRLVYAPCHNIGHLRFLECASLDREGNPMGGVRYWSDALFPYDPHISVDQRLSPGQIEERYDLEHTRVCETYSCDSDGVITVHFEREADRMGRTFEVFKG